MLFETDQIACYDTHGHRIDCQNTGQDASFKRSSRPIIANRFSVQDGSVYFDSHTARTWCVGDHFLREPFSWEAALRIQDETKYPILKSWV